MRPLLRFDFAPGHQPEAQARDSALDPVLPKEPSPPPVPCSRCGLVKPSRSTARSFSRKLYIVPHERLMLGHLRPHLELTEYSDCWRNDIKI
ncbi:hypothetical protein Pan189_30000 [Stratiformator vulcanicus]|uniref:Uncharacterized protein n=1 Tax=Stratiformator vulcanicus TaxID=2527980 RepID=A0A517R3Z2_9PLAN|nr:hypothetical protein Pan189_30000 [Stratiformator vulcanicus]